MTPPISQPEASPRKPLTSLLTSPLRTPLQTPLGTSLKRPVGKPLKTPLQPLLITPLRLAGQPELPSAASARRPQPSPTTRAPACAGAIN